MVSLTSPSDPLTARPILHGGPHVFSVCLCKQAEDVLTSTNTKVDKSQADLHGLAGTLFENVLAGAPPFAPLLLPNLSILGFIGIAAMLREALA